MPPRAVTIDRFPGLDLRQDPAEWPGALDAMNVTLESGRVRARSGMTTFATLTEPRYMVSVSVGPAASTDQALVVATSANVQAFEPGGASIPGGAFAAGDDPTTSGVVIGTPTVSYLYIKVGTAIRRWDGTAWTSPAGMPASPSILSASPTDNRLIVCSGVRASFSDAGAPETFGANNYVDLRPGDGEVIKGAAVYNNQTFIFKSTRFFVFYGNSTNSVGQPEFNYHTVEGEGLRTAQAQSVTTGPDGVYFIGRDGIYRTTGGQPVRISDAIRPFFTDEATVPFWTGGRWSFTGFAQNLQWFGGKLYALLARQTGNPIIFVFDPATSSWTAWETALAALKTMGQMVVDQSAGVAAVATLKDPALLFGVASRVAYMNEGATADVTTAISSRYRSGFMDFGTPAMKTIRETAMDGIGSPTLAWSRDWGSVPAGSGVTLGSSPATAVGRQREASRGRRFSFQLSAESAWTVNNLQPLVHAERPVYVA